MSDIANVPAHVELVKILFNDQVRMRLSSQFISGFSKVLQTLLKFFNVIYISNPLYSTGLTPVILNFKQHYLFTWLIPVNFPKPSTII